MPEPIDITAVRALRFELSLYLDEMAQRAADMLEAVGMARAKLAQLEAACEGRVGESTAPMPTTDDTE